MRLVSIVILALDLAACATATIDCCTVTRVHDDFSGPALDLTKWTVDDPAGLLSQHDGRLFFSASTTATSRIVSMQPVHPAFYILRFRDFHSSNMSPSGKHEGSWAGLGLLSGNTSVRALRGNVRDGGYFEANHSHNGALVIWYVNNSASEGQKTPAWTSAPRLYLGGYRGGSGTTTFSVETVSEARAHVEVPAGT